MTPFSESLSLVIHICQHNDSLCPAWKVSSSLRTKHDNRLYDAHAKCYKITAFCTSCFHSACTSVFPFSQAPVGKVWTSPRGTSKRGNYVSFVIFLHKGGKWVRLMHTEGPQPGATWLSSYDYFWIGGGVSWPNHVRSAGEWEGAFLQWHHGVELCTELSLLTDTLIKQDMIRYDSLNGLYTRDD